MAVAQPVLSNADQSIPYVRMPGSTPFFSGTQVQPGHNSLCKLLQATLEECGNEDGHSRREKANLRACARTFMEMHDYRDKNLTKLYKDAEAAHRFMKNIVKDIGLRLQCSNKRVSPSSSSSSSAGRRQRLAEIMLSSHEIAIMLTLKDNFRNAVLALLPLLMNSDNISEQDKELFRDGIDAYNAAQAKVGRNSPIVTGRPRNRIIGVIPRRIAEIDLERSNRICYDSAGEESDYNCEDSEQLHAAIAISNHDSVALNNQQRNRYKALAESQNNESVDYSDIDRNDEEDDDDDDDSVGNPFILDSAIEH